MLEAGTDRLTERGRETLKKQMRERGRGEQKQQSESRVHLNKKSHQYQKCLYLNSIFVNHISHILLMGVIFLYSQVFYGKH